MSVDGDFCKEKDLLAYSQGILGRRTTLDRLGLRDSTDLLVALGDADLPLPSPPPHIIENQAATFAKIWRSARATLILPDAGPINSLWVADELPLFLALDMPIVVVDAVYDEMTSDPSYRKDREVKVFLDTHQPPFQIAKTDIGQQEREKRQAGHPLKKNAGELAIIDFLSSEEGLRHYLQAGDLVVLLFEDADVRIINKPPHLHILSTVGLLRGLERVGIVRQADPIIHAMTHPTAQGRRPADAHISVWKPTGPR